MKYKLWFIWMTISMILVILWLFAGLSVKIDDESSKEFLLFVGIPIAANAIVCVTIGKKAHYE